jgi:hypothetical protein
VVVAEVNDDAVMVALLTTSPGEQTRAPNTVRYRGADAPTNGNNHLRDGWVMNYPLQLRMRDEITAIGRVNDRFVAALLEQHGENMLAEERAALLGQAEVRA